MKFCARDFNGFFNIAAALEIDVVKIKSVMKNVTLPPIEKSSVSSLSTKMKDLSDSEFRTVMQKMLSSKKTNKK